MNNILEIFTIPEMLTFSDNIIFISLLCLAVIIILFKLVASENMLSSVILVSLFSSVLCCIYLLMDAPDVAMTEAAVGACISTVILLLVLSKIKNNSATGKRKPIVAFISCVLLGIALALSGKGIFYGDSPVQDNASKHYLQKSGEEIRIPSVVASILASYRGFDTLGETTVILIAGIVVLLILGFKNE